MKHPPWNPQQYFWDSPKTNWDILKLPLDPLRTSRMPLRLFEVPVKYPESYLKHLKPSDVHLNAPKVLLKITEIPLKPFEILRHKRKRLRYTLKTPEISVRLPWNQHRPTETTVRPSDMHLKTLWNTTESPLESPDTSLKPLKPYDAPLNAPKISLKLIETSLKRYETLGNAPKTLWNDSENFSKTTEILKTSLILRDFLKSPGTLCNVPENPLNQLERPCNHPWNCFKIP